MDDNVLYFDGVTLMNDPFPRFGCEPRHDRSQISHISLLSILNHFNFRKLNDKMSEYAAIGFSIGFDKKFNKRKHAYSRQFVHVAVILNLRKLPFNYLKQMWAMEDIEFINRVNSISDQSLKESGLIVKCKRFVAVKKRLNHGGVVIPAEQKTVCQKYVSRQTEARKRSIEEKSSTPSKKGRPDVTPNSNYFSPKKASHVKVPENNVPDLIPHPSNFPRTVLTVEPEPEKNISLSSNVSEKSGYYQNETSIPSRKVNSSEKNFEVIALESESSSIENSIESSTNQADANLSFNNKSVLKSQEDIIKKQNEEINRLKSELTKSREREENEKAEKEKEKAEKEKVIGENAKLKKALECFIK